MRRVSASRSGPQACELRPKRREQHGRNYDASGWLGNRGRAADCRLSRLTVGIIVACLVAWLPSYAQSFTQTEYRIKANFLATFPNFIDWPEDAFPSAKAPFLVCVVGGFSFGTSLVEATRGILPHGRRMDVVWVHKDQEMRSCHILFVSHSEGKRYAKILQAVQGADVLTVGETPNFLEAGGAMTFAFQEDVLQFDVNLGAAIAEPT